MMSDNKNLEMRRVFRNIRYIDYDYKIVKNPMYDSQQEKDYMLKGYHYPIEEYIEKEVPITRIKRTSHIEYKIKCEHCQTSGWVRRKDAKYCSGNCRKLAFKERKSKATGV